LLASAAVQEKVWEYGSSDRRRFYFTALTDTEIDQLNSPWVSDTASTFVPADCLHPPANRSELIFSCSQLVFNCSTEQCFVQRESPPVHQESSSVRA
jgi:hypothetical protein